MKFKFSDKPNTEFYSKSKWDKEIAGKNIRPLINKVESKEDMSCINKLCEPISECASFEMPSMIENIKIYKNGKVYFDNKYFGKITELSDSGFKIVCENNNRYMKGQIINFEFTNAKSPIFVDVNYKR